MRRVGHGKQTVRERKRNADAFEIPTLPKMAGFVKLNRNQEGKEKMLYSLQLEHILRRNIEFH